MNRPGETRSGPFPDYKRYTRLSTVASSGAMKTACLSKPFFAKFAEGLANSENTFYVTPRGAGSAFDVRL